MYNILVACEAGRRRSPITAAYLQHFAPEYGLAIAASSAAGKAWAAPSGERPVSESATIAMQGRGIPEIADQRQRKLTPELAARADLILTINDELLGIARQIGAPPERSSTIRGYLDLPAAPINDVLLDITMPLEDRLRLLAPMLDELEGYSHGILRKLATHLG